MRSPRWPWVLAGVCIVMLPLQGQTNDWSSVRKLAPGTSISVVKRVRQGCRVVMVTDSELACDREIGRLDTTLVFARDQVREVRLEEFEQNRMITGAIIGAIAGGLVGCIGGGQARDPETRAYTCLYGSPAGGWIGGLIGRGVYRHGRVVYRR